MNIIKGIKKLCILPEKVGNLNYRAFQQRVTKMKKITVIVVMCLFCINGISNIKVGAKTVNEMVEEALTSIAGIDAFQDDISNKKWVYAVIDPYELTNKVGGEIMDANDVFLSAMSFTHKNPLNTGVGAGQLGFDLGELKSSLTNIFVSLGTTLAVLFFLIDFLNRTIEFRIQELKDILPPIARVFITKAVLQNGYGICCMLYNEFSAKLTFSIMGSDVANQGFISSFFGGATVGMTRYDPSSVSDVLNIVFEAMKLSPVLSVAGNYLQQYATDAQIVKYADYQIGYFFAPDILNGVTSQFNYGTILTFLLYYILALILKLLMFFFFAIFVGRMMEIVIYALFSPLPMSTFATSITSDIGKSFLKNFVAVCLQSFVAIVFVTLYAQLINMNIIGLPSKWATMLVLTLTLCIGVAKSGQIAAKITGAA